jgi:glycosyltransferase involved in cell wall biosynthesis
MKFLHVIASMNPRIGGPCQGIRNLATWFIKNDNQIEVVCLDDPNSDFLSRDNFPVHALGQSWSQWSYHSRLLPWLHDNLSRFDVVILNGLWQYPGYALLKATRKPNMPPYFVFPHGMLDPWFQRNPQRRIKAIRNWFYWKYIEQRVVHNAAALLFTSAEEMRLARETFSPYQPKREVNVGYGIPEPPEYHSGMEAAFAEKCPALKGKPYFLFLSRIHPKKGVDLLINAYAAFCRSQTAVPPAKLVIAGPGLETYYGQQLQTLAAQICLPGSVYWPGMLSGDAKWGALYNCEAFILPSHQENYGIAVVEALSCGRPVLISNQVNIWREIEEDAAGFVVGDTLKGTRELFRRWANLSDQFKTIMGKAARASYENRFAVALPAGQLFAAVGGLAMHARGNSLPKDEVKISK